MGGRGKSGQLRIIGGQWRGRKLGFPSLDGLRPTTDRVRETLFNWLQVEIHGARCADLFAGSGALGLEALSRGASSCDFVDTSEAALRSLQSHLETLAAADRGHCHRDSAVSFLQQAAGSYDVVFIDPPFGKGLVQACCEQLAQRSLLAADARIYIEMAVDESLPAMPRGWALHREKRAGGVAYRLFVVGQE